VERDVTADELEALIGAALAELPAPAAPPTLAPRVLAAAAAAGSVRPGWPMPWRWASAAAVMVLVAGAWWLSPVLGDWFARLWPDNAGAALSMAAGLASAGASLLGAAARLVGSAATVGCWVGLAVAAAMAVSIASGAALKDLAWGGGSHS
jgi:hypothetical protein